MINTACASPADEPERNSRQLFKVPLRERDDTCRILLLAFGIPVVLLLAARFIRDPATPAPSLVQTAKDALAAMALAHGIVLWKMRAWGCTRVAVALFAFGLLLSVVNFP